MSKRPVYRSFTLSSPSFPQESDEQPVCMRKSLLLFSPISGKKKEIQGFKVKNQTIFLQDLAKCLHILGKTQKKLLKISWQKENEKILEN